MYEGLLLSMIAVRHISRASSETESSVNCCLSIIKAIDILYQHRLQHRPCFCRLLYRQLVPAGKLKLQTTCGCNVLIAINEP
jgi:hypothetical protein